MFVAMSVAKPEPLGGRAHAAVRRRPGRSLADVDAASSPKTYSVLRDRPLSGGPAAHVVRRDRVEEHRVSRDVHADGSGSMYWPVLYAPTSIAPRHNQSGSGRNVL